MLEQGGTLFVALTLHLIVPAGINRMLCGKALWEGDSRLRMLCLHAELALHPSLSHDRCLLSCTHNGGSDHLGQLPHTARSPAT